MADLHSKILDTRPPPPPGVQILSISCSFWEILAKSYVGAPQGVGHPPRGNPGSATEVIVKENLFVVWNKNNQKHSGHSREESTLGYFANFFLLLNLCMGWYRILRGGANPQVEGARIWFCQFFQSRLKAVIKYQKASMQNSPKFMSQKGKKFPLSVDSYLSELKKIWAETKKKIS